MEHCILNGCAVQTDIAQFQVDEIMLKLHDLQVRFHFYIHVFGSTFKFQGNLNYRHNFERSF